MTFPVLTKDENAVVTLLGEAWNGFLRLQPILPSDVRDFEKAINDAQRIVLARPAVQIVEADVLSALLKRAAAK